MKSVLLIGLGRFGTNVAIKLSELGHEVMAVDYDEERVDDILPIVTTMGPLTAAVLTGTFVLEKIYAVPGMGKFYVQSINDLDYTMVLGMTTFYGIFLVTANLIVDILYGVIDPRIKLADGGGGKKRKAKPAAAGKEA